MTPFWSTLMASDSAPGTAAASASVRAMSNAIGSSVRRAGSSGAAGDRCGSPAGHLDARGGVGEIEDLVRRLLGRDHGTTEREPAVEWQEEVAQRHVLERELDGVGLGAPFVHLLVDRRDRRMVGSKSIVRNVITPGASDRSG
jgi:hypothetical protein